MADYDNEPTTKRAEPHLRDRLTSLEKATAQMGEVLNEVRRQVRRLAEEVGLDE